MEESKITFKPFREWFFAQKTSNGKYKQKKELLLETGLFPKTAAKIWQDGNVSLNTVTVLCKTYNLRLDQVIQYEPGDDENGGTYE